MSIWTIEHSCKFAVIVWQTACIEWLSAMHIKAADHPSEGLATGMPPQAMTVPRVQGNSPAIITK
jgi:hypothetical protein